MSIRLSNERCEEIKLIVVEMFVKYDVSCVPISGFEIAKKMGIRVIPYSVYPESTQLLMLKKSEDGFSVEKNIGEWSIFFNDDRPYGRINHTMMHEIAHIILDHTEDSELAEKEVKFFAKYALVPPVLVHKLKLHKPEDVARIFGVSLEAAGYALGYYEKRLAYGDKGFTPYEIITLVQSAVGGGR